jgi:hypothetical protein
VFAALPRVGVVLAAANRDTNQNSYADSNREWDKRAVFGLSCNLIQGIIADSRTYLHCLIPQTARPVDRRALATTETIYNVV